MVQFKYEVLDVQTMVASSPSGNITWTEGSDHAKWAGEQLYYDNYLLLSWLVLRCMKLILVPIM